MQEGLKQKEAEKKLREYGFNKVKEEERGLLKKFFQWVFSAITLMLVAAAVLSWFTQKYFDAYFILGLIFMNISVGVWQEYKADRAIQNLSKKLAVRIKVKRDGKWKWINARYLVPRDVIELTAGDLIPADLEIVEAKNISIDESVLTGESLPKDKNESDICYSGSFIRSGWMRAQVVSTGEKTYFGKILVGIEKSSKRSLLEKDILNIAKFLSFISLAAVVILSVFFFLRKENLTELATLDLSLLIAGIPVSLPAVMTLITSFGILELARKKVIVRRLSALEDLANVNILLTDKTGTLTKNKIQVTGVLPYDDFSEQELMNYAYLAASQTDRHPINQAIIEKANAWRIKPKFKIENFVQADSERKRATFQGFFRNKKITVSSGAPQIVEKLCRLSPAVRKKLFSDIDTSAREGYRAIAISAKHNFGEEKNMDLVGLVLLSDTLVNGAKTTIRFMEKNGIAVKMLTGDNVAISKRIAGNLMLKGKSIGRKILGKIGSRGMTKSWLSDKAVFFEILPRDKYNLVKAYARTNTVAVTGDGINDLPAIKAADVGIAVQNSVDALKSSADIVLLGSGISFIQDAIIEARKIFSRLYTYSIYRISESFRLIVTITLLGLFYGIYPLSAIQIIILAFLNDIPIISLATDRVKKATQPMKIHARERYLISSFFGMTGVINSVILFLILKNLLNLPWPAIQTIFFLKLTISGHMLIYVAHTKERWYKFLPSKTVITATIATQLLGTTFALLGIFMSKISIFWIVFVWLWAFLWMQISEVVKWAGNKIVWEDN